MPDNGLGRIVMQLAAIAILLAVAPLCPAGELRNLEPQAAPALNLPDLAGQSQGLDAWRGQVVLLNFWASWCQPCLEEMPGIQRLAEKMQGQPFVVVGINVAEARRKVERTLAQWRIDFPVLLDAEGATFRTWGGKVLPTGVLIDHQGRLRYVGLGPLEWDGAEVVSACEELLVEARSGGR